MIYILKDIFVFTCSSISLLKYALLFLLIVCLLDYLSTERHFSIYMYCDKDVFCIASYPTASNLRNWDSVEVWILPGFSVPWNSPYYFLVFVHQVKFVLSLLCSFILIK